MLIKSVDGKKKIYRMEKCDFVKSINSIILVKLGPTDIITSSIRVFSNSIKRQY